MSAAIAGAINALVAKPARSNFFTVTLPQTQSCCCIFLLRSVNRVCDNLVTFC
jgi:hypothetical protein